MNANRRRKPALIRRAKNRAALVQNAGRVLRRQRDVLHRIVQPLISLQESDALITQSPARLRRAADDRIQTRTIPAAGENAYSLLIHNEASVEIRLGNSTPGNYTTHQ